MWDLHSALGFWCFVFVLAWGISGAYFGFPSWFNVLDRFDAAGRLTNTILYALASVHFGRFGSFAEIVWVVFGLVPVFSPSLVSSFAVAA